MTRIETKPSLQSKAPIAGDRSRGTRDRDEKIWRRSRKSRSERSAGRNCSSSRPRPSWNDWKRRHRPRRRQKSADPSAGKNDPQDAGAAKPKPVDPKQIKAGYQKAIELAPRAVEQMERAVKSLKQKDPQAAYPPAEEARKILEEIQKAQPRQDQQDQKQQDQNKKNDDQQKQDQKDQQKKDEQKKDQQKDDQREEGPAEERPAEEGSGTEEAGRAEEVRRAEAGSETASSRRSRAIGSKRRCGRSANGSRKSANETAR